MAKNTLTEKQAAFCKQVALGKSGSEAYRLAFKSSSAGTCKVNGSRLLKQPLIAAKIKELQKRNSIIADKAQAKVAEGVVVEFEVASVAERMHILTQIARGQIPLFKPMVCDGVIEQIEVVPDWMDRKNAITELNKMTGDYAPAKTEMNITGIPDVIYPGESED